jgi:uncharacterized membrane protein (UPF0136 family)
MSGLEQTYHNALRWYPKKWRTANEDAMVGTLLDLADNDRRSAPARGELADLRSSGIASRFGILARLADSEATALASVVSLALGSAISGAGLVSSAWTWQSNGTTFHQLWSLTPLIENLGTGLSIYTLWLIAFVTAIVGLRRVTSVVLAISIVASAVLFIVGSSLPHFEHPGGVALAFLDVLAVMCIAGRVASRRRTALGVTTILAAVALWVTWWLRGHLGGYWGNGANNIDQFWAPLAAWLVWAGIPTALVLAIVFGRLGRRALSGAALLAAAPFLLLGLFAFGRSSDILPVAATVLAVLALAALTIGILRLLGLRIRVTRS